VPGLFAFPTSVGIPLRTSTLTPGGAPGPIVTVGAGIPLVITGIFNLVPAATLTEPGLSKVGVVGCTVRLKGTEQVPLPLDAITYSL
jgi:hypothetical protein